jgi:hypothetical protein
MRARHVGRVRFVGVCLASLLILLVVVVTACGASPVDTPVSASSEDPPLLGTTSPPGSGPADLYCSVTFAATLPKGVVFVSLSDEAGEFIDGRDGPYTFKGLQPGKYRLGVFGGETGYISQWYGGLPMQGHDVSESQMLELKPGRNAADFVLQPGLSIQGQVSWTQGTRLTGRIRAYDLQQQDTLRGAILLGTAAGSSARFLIVGLLPGRYKLGVSFDEGVDPPQFWDGGGSFEHAPVIDLTSRDVAGIHLKLGALPTPTTAASGQ